MDQKPQLSALSLGALWYRTACPFEAFRSTQGHGRMIPLLSVSTERRVCLCTVSGSLWVSSLSRQPGRRVKDITHKVIIFNEAGANAPLNTRAPFDNIPGVGWPLAEFRIETIGDTTCEKNFPSLV